MNKIQIEAVEVKTFDGCGSVLLATNNNAGFKVKGFKFYFDDVAFEVAEICKNVIQNCNGNYNEVDVYTEYNNVIVSAPNGKTFTLKHISHLNALYCAEIIKEIFRELPTLETLEETDSTEINTDNGKIILAATGNAATGFNLLVSCAGNTQTIPAGNNTDFAEDTRDFLGAIITGCKGNVDLVTIGFGSIDDNALVLARVGDKVLSQIYSDYDSADHAAEIIDKVFGVIRDSAQISDNKKAAV